MDAIFKPSVDYYTSTNGGLPYLSQVFGKARTFDLVKVKSNNYLLDENNTAGIATFQYNGVTYTGTNLETTYQSGVNGALTYDTSDNSLVIKYTSGEAFTSGSCRSQVNSYALPTGVPLFFEFDFKLGNDWPLEYTYDSATSGLANSQTLIWQCKTTTAVNGPFLSIYVLTHPDNSPSIDFCYSPTGFGLDRVIIASIVAPKLDTWYSFKLRTCLLGPINKLVGSLGGNSFNTNLSTPVWASPDIAYPAQFAFGTYCFYNNASSTYNSIITGLPMNNPANCPTRTLKVKTARVSMSSNTRDLIGVVTRKTRS